MKSESSFAINWAQVNIPVRCFASASMLATLALVQAHLCESHIPTTGGRSSRFSGALLRFAYRAHDFLRFSVSRMIVASWATPPADKHGHARNIRGRRSQSALA